MRACSLLVHRSNLAVCSYITSPRAGGWEFLGEGTLFTYHLYPLSEGSLQPGHSNFIKHKFKNGCLNFSTGLLWAPGSRERWQAPKYPAVPNHLGWEVYHGLSEIQIWFMDLTIGRSVDDKTGRFKSIPTHIRRRKQIRAVALLSLVVVILLSLFWYLVISRWCLTVHGSRLGFRLFLEAY